MLGEGVERPGWDLEGRFTPSSVQLYFENKAEELVKVTLMSQPQSDSTLLGDILYCKLSNTFILHQVNHETTLSEAVSKKGFLLKGGTPAFIVLVKDAKFTNDFLSKYTIRK